MSIGEQPFVDTTETGRLVYWRLDTPANIHQIFETAESSIESKSGNTCSKASRQNPLRIRVFVTRSHRSDDTLISIGVT